MEVYREEARELAVGDRIQFRAPLKAHQIPNGALGTITTWENDSGQVTIALDAGSSVSTTEVELRHIEYGYATTSHSSQGATIDRVLVNVDTEQSVALVNQQQFYVSLSRTRIDAQVFTNKQDELAQAVSRCWPKSTALDAVTPPDDGPDQTRGSGEDGPTRGGPGGRSWQPQPDTERHLLALPVIVTRSVGHARPVQALDSTQQAHAVRQRETDWRGEQTVPIHTQAVTQTPLRLHRERPASQREETPKQQPERSRGIRYRM